MSWLIIVSSFALTVWAGVATINWWGNVRLRKIWWERSEVLETQAKGLRKTIANQDDLIDEIFMGWRRSIDTSNDLTLLNTELRSWLEELNAASLEPATAPTGDSGEDHPR